MTKDLTFTPKVDENLKHFLTGKVKFRLQNMQDTETEAKERWHPVFRKIPKYFVTGLTREGWGWGEKGGGVGAFLT